MNKRHNDQLIRAVRTICRRRSGLSAPAFALLGFSMVSVAIAGPTGGVVVTGDATISTPAAGTTVIDQASQHVQLNWNTFDVGASESVQFHQPSSSSVALNRILDQNPSQIFGRIDANGQVILVNPNGMLFGHSAQLNVGSLVASSLDVIGFDAATGRYTFGASRTDAGAIVNDGAIAAGRGGSVTLLGGRITNNGSIVADFGTVNLAAGRAATLDLAGDGLLRLEVDGELLTNNAGASAAVENHGVIEANGGQVLLTAKAVDDVFANLVNNTGVVRANRIDNSGGTIRLMGAGGTVRSSGVLDASAGDAVSSGGRVEVLGEQVGLFDSALVDVSGATSGGTALIGGDYQGKNPEVLNAARTYVSSDASIRADAGLTGDGGRVIVWADEITRFYGSISARGGALSGNGGFAEVSGKETLLFRGSANLSAANGFAGELLLDPRNLIIATGGAGDLAGGTGDDSDADTYAFAEDADDDITIAPATITGILDTGTTVTLQAHNDITVTNAIDGSASTTPGGGLVFQAGDDIVINADVRTNDGVIQFTAGDNAATPTGADGDDAPTGELTLASGVTLSAGAAAVTLRSDENMQLLGTVSGNAITAVSGGTLTVATLDAGTGSVNLTATGSLLDDGDNATRITAGDLVLAAVTGIGATGAIGQIDTSVSTLSATADAGSVYIGEQNGVTLTNVSAAGAGSDVNVTSTTGSIVVGAVTAANAVTLNAMSGTTGFITDDGDNGTRITAGTVTLTGAAIGASGGTDQVDTDVTSLTATAGAGSVYIGELNGVTLTSVSATGAGNDVVVTSATGNIQVGDVSAPDAVILAATAGAITDDDDNGTRIAADALTLTAGTGIGAIGLTGQIDTFVSSLTASADAGDIYLRESNGLTLTNVSATSGDVQVTTATGDLVVNIVTAADAVSLAATTGAIVDDGDGATSIAANGLTLSAGTSIGTSIAALGTDVDSLTAVATDGGVYIAEADDVTLTTVTAGGVAHDVEVSSANGNIIAGAIAASDDAVTLTATGAITDDSNDTTRITADTLTLTAGTAIGAAGVNEQIDTDVTSLAATAGAGNVNILEANGLTLTNVSAAAAGGDVNVTSNTGGIVVNAVTAADVVSLTALAGAITDDGNNATRITAATLTMNAGTAIGAVGANDQLDTDVTALSANAAAGSVHVGESNDITLVAVNAGGTGSDVNVTSTAGNIIVNTVSAADEVTLDATAGFITDDFSNTTRITAQTATLTGLAIGAAVAGGQIDTDVSALSATGATGGVHIGELNGVTLTNVSSGGVGNDVIVTSTTGNLVVDNVTASGAVELTAAAGDIVVSSITAAEPVTLTATAGSILDDDDNATRIGAATLTLDAGTAIGAAGGSGQIDTEVSSLTASAATGDVYIGELDGVTLTNVSATGAGGDVNVRNNTGDIVVNTVTAAGAVTLTLAAGSIVDDGDNATRIGADALTLSARDIGATGANSEIDTNVNTLTATAWGGSAYIGEQNGLAMTNVSAAGAGGAVSVTSATGNIVVGDISAVDAVTLTAATGAITDDDDNTSVISGSSVSLSAATNIGTVVDFDAANDANVGSSLDVQTSGALTASVASNNGQINLNISGTPTLAAGAITLGSGSNRSGAIVLQSAGDLNAAGLTPGAISIGSGNTTQLGLRSGGVLTLPSSGGFTDQPVDQLLVRGATDVVNSDGTRAFALTATTLDFRSGAAGGATILNTTVGRLDATVGNDQNLTVNETNGVTLGTLDAGNGNITLTAIGAISDDGDDLTRIVSNAATLSGTSLGAAGNALDTQVNTLTASATSGGVHINELDALALTVSATGAADVRTAGGSLTVAAATGDGVTLIAGGAGSDITLNGAVNAGAGDVTLTAGTSANRGAIVGGTGHHITGDALTATGATIGTDLARLNTTVALLNATSANGGIFITETDALSLAANASGGAVDVETTNGALTVTQATGNAVTLTAGGAGSGITLNGAVNAGAGNVTLTAGTAADRGAIVAGTGHQITGGSLTATGATIGTNSARLNTAVASLDATSSNGGIFITEANALNLSASATNGIADVRTTNGALAVTSVTGNGVTLTAGGAGNGITLNGAVNAGVGDVTLTAGTTANRGAIVAGTGHQITGGSLTATGATIGTIAANLNTSVASLNATSSNGGIFITEADALSLAANASGGAVDVATTNGALTVTQATGNAVMLTAGGASSGLTLNGAVNAGTGDVTLTAGSAITLNGTVNTGAGDVTLTAGGAGSDITLNGAVNAGTGDVILTAGTAASRGEIAAGAGHQITGGSLTATGAAIGTVAARLNTSVASLDAISSNGGIFITESDALSLAANASGGAVDVATTDGALTVTQATGNAVTLTAGGAGNGLTLNGTVNTGAGDVTLTAGGAGGGITLNGAVNAGTGDVTLTAGTAASRGAIVAGAGHQISGGSLTATGAWVGTDAARLNTAVASLNATSSNGGIFITESDALSLAANASGGAVDVATANGALIVTQATGNSLTLSAGGAGNGITLNGAVNAGTGDVTLTAGTAASRGAIVAGAGHQISGGSLTATAASIGASNARLNTSIDTLNALASTGDVYISEQNGLTLANVSAGRDIGVTSVAGDIVVNTVAATNAVTLTATSGAIADDGDDSTSLSAKALTLSARSMGAASTLSGTTLNSTARLDTDVETLNATATAGGIFIDEANGLQNVSVQASGGDAGDIELLTRAGDLNLQRVSASDTLLLAAGRNIFAVAGAGPVTARVAELRAGAADSAGGQIGRPTDPIEFQLSAGNSLRLFVPQTVDPNDPNRSPATQPSAGVTTTLSQFPLMSTLAILAGFNQFQGFGEIQFTSPAEALVRSLQSQTGTVQAGLDIDWGSFDPEVSLFGTLEPSVCLPGDQRDEETSTPDC